jgi:hypothetical protein
MGVYTRMGNKREFYWLNIHIAMLEKDIWFLAGRSAGFEIYAFPSWSLGTRG